MREALHARLAVEHAHERDTTLFVDEMGLSGLARVDVAVVNGHLSGFELKSASDTLRRLPSQADIYSRVFDYVTLVVADKHVSHALPIIPDWWGVYRASEAATGVVELETLRPAVLNTHVVALAVAELLWRPECLDILHRYDADKGYRSKSRLVLWERLTEVLTLEDLQRETRQALKARTHWRSAA